MIGVISYSLYLWRYVRMNIERRRCLQNFMSEQCVHDFEGLD
jgi:hypothetical protein